MLVYLGTALEDLWIHSLSLHHLGTRGHGPRAWGLGPNQKAGGRLVFISLLESPLIAFARHLVSALIPSPPQNGSLNLTLIIHVLPHVPSLSGPEVTDSGVHLDLANSLSKHSFTHFLISILIPPPQFQCSFFNLLFFCILLSSDSSGPS